MQIETVEDLLKIIEEKRVEQNLTMMALSELVGKSPKLYWWIKHRGTTLSVATTLDLLNALGLKITIK